MRLTNTTRKFKTPRSSQHAEPQNPHVPRSRTSRDHKPPDLFQPGQPPKIQSIQQQKPVVEHSNSGSRSATKGL